MIESISYYLIGALSVSNFVVIWKLTSISNHFFNFFNKFKRNKVEVFTVEDLEDHLILHWGWFGELLVCPLCLATHLSWLTGLVIFLITGCSPFIILYGACTWPLISYLALGLSKKVQ
jgi:hypothetical protein